MKILITGNPNYAIGKGINNSLKDVHELKFVGLRTNCMDLTDDKKILELSNLSLDYDIFINNSRLVNFRQCILFETVYNTWFENKKSGHIINIGSAGDVVREKQWSYGPEKVALRKYSEQASFASAYKKTNIKVTYIAFGWVDTPLLEKYEPNVKKHTILEIGNLIKWVIDYPINSTNINEIRIEPIQ